MKSPQHLVGYLLILSAIVFYSTSCKKQAVSNTGVTETSTDQLQIINANVLVGSPVDIDSINLIPKYKNIVLTQFNCGQAKWYARYGGWNGPYDYDFNNFNGTVNWLAANKKSPMMHMLIGPDSYMPDWLLNKTWTKAQLDSMLKKMIYAFMDANDNKNKVDVWNVVNEAFNYDNGAYQAGMIWNQLGWENDKSGLTGADKINAKHPIFIRKAFQYCRDKTNKKLELRDYNIENNNSTYGFDDKHKGFYQLVKHMLNSGIPLDAVGIQGHHEISNINWLTQNNDLQTIVTKFKALGLDVYITEMDMASGTQTWNNTLAQQQKNDYYNYILQSINGGASRVCTWGISDGDPYWLTNEHPLLWDENYNKKPAYYGVKQALVETR